MKNQKVIYSYILSMVHNCSDADDIMQETMTLMWERFGQFQPGTNFGAWGVKVARFKTLSYLKKNKRSEEVFDESLMAQIENCYSRKVERMNTRLIALQDCLKKLNDRDRKLIRILYEEGLKITELSNRLNRPVEGLYKVIARIHTVLRRCVSKTVLKWDL
jgi:RNA polymerase sigma-70 factor (ECF subfamily)